jgi:hypothetical protein
VRDRVRSEANISDTVKQIIRIYEEVVAENEKRASESVAELRAFGAYLQSLSCILKKLGL